MTVVDARRETDDSVIVRYMSVGKLGNLLLGYTNIFSNKTTKKLNGNS